MIRSLAPLVLALNLSAQITLPVFRGDLIPPASGYYADSVSGSDANVGTLAAPFATISHLMSIDSSAPRKIWNLHKDSVWHEMALVPRDGMTVQAYGSGTNPPQLDGGVTISTGAWSQPRGAGTCYQASVAVDLSAPGWLNVWEDGTELPFVSSTGGCDSTAGTYYVAQDSNGATSNPSTLYVHATGGGNPATNGKLYEYSYIRSGVYTNANAVTVNGIWTRRNYAFDGSMKFQGANGRVMNSRLSQGSKHNIVASTPFRMDSTLVDEAYFAANGAAMVQLINAGSETNKPGDLYGVTVSLSTYDANIGAFGMHGVNGGDVGLISYYNCAVNNMAGAYTDAGNGLYMSNSNATNVAIGAVGNTVLNVVGGTLDISPGSSHAGIKVTSSTTVVNVSGGAMIQTSTTGGDGYASGCILVQSRSTPVALSFVNSICQAVSLGHFANAISSSGGSGPIALTVSGSTLNVDWLNFFPMYSLGITGSTFTGGGNHYTSATIGAGTTFTALGSTNYTYVAWKAAGFDAGSTP